MNFDGSFTASSSANTFGGDGAADFVLGLPFEYGRGVSTGKTWEQSSNLIGIYQDTWRVTDRLTLNLGLRYGCAYAAIRNYTFPFFFFFFWGGFSFSYVLLARMIPSQSSFVKSVITRTLGQTFSRPWEFAVRHVSPPNRSGQTVSGCPPCQRSTGRRQAGQFAQ